MIQVALVFLAALVLSLLIALAFIRRYRTFLGLLIGLLPIAATEVAYNWALRSSIQRCLNSACSSAGLPPGCTIAEFGCTEWSGISFFIFAVAGIVSLILYAIGVGAMAILHSARRRSPPPTTSPPDAAA
jgi:hypothetical protein